MPGLFLWVCSIEIADKLGVSEVLESGRVVCHRVLDAAQVIFER